MPLPKDQSFFFAHSTKLVNKASGEMEMRGMAEPLDRILCPCLIGFALVCAPAEAASFCGFGDVRNSFEPCAFAPPMPMRAALLTAESPRTAPEQRRPERN
jgi:hypothetical protein